MNQRVFCRFCLNFYGCLRDYDLHYIRRHREYGGTHLSKLQITYLLKNCVDTRNRSIYYFIFINC